MYIYMYIYIFQVYMKLCVYMYIISNHRCRWLNHQFATIPSKHPSGHIHTESKH